MENPQKSLESARQRFSQLVSTLSAFNNVLCHGPPDSLPPWSTLQSQFNVISASLASVSSSLTQHFPPAHDNPAALVSYPLPNFPAQTQSILLSMLCNKKPSAPVQDWFIKGLNDTDVTTLSAQDKEAQNEFWRAVQDVVSDLQDGRNWYDELYTLEEREGEGGIEAVETGLVLERGEVVRREEKEKVGAGLRLESMLRFMGTGVMPRDQPPLPTGLAQAGMMKR